MVVDYSFLQYYLILLVVYLVGAVRIDALTAKATDVNIVAKTKDRLTFCAGTR